MLSYVGPVFGITGPRPIRLAIVGMDHGDNDCGSYSDRTDSIIGCYLDRGERFNPHYRGVVRTAAAFLGQIGAQCAEDCWINGRCRKSERPEVEDCVLERIAQPNIVKCVPQISSRTSLSTPTMGRNCTNHLLAEWDIYKPNICIFHGVKSKWQFLAAAREMGFSAEALPVPTATPDTAYNFPSIPAKLFFFQHPSRNGLNRQWSADVEPCLKYLRREGEID